MALNDNGKPIDGKKKRKPTTMIKRLHRAIAGSKPLKVFARGLADTDSVEAGLACEWMANKGMI